MSDNPLDNDPARENRIKERAYHLWEADGGPHGRHDEYWERARELVGMEDSAGAAQLPIPDMTPGADAMLVEPVEEAFIQENLGEFPDRFADQGEAQPTPKARRSAGRAKIAADPSTGAKGVAEDRVVQAGPFAQGEGLTRFFPTSAPPPCCCRGPASCAA